MPDKITIDVFGIRNQSVGCNGGSCSSKTMGEMYDEFNYYLTKNINPKQFKTQFIDILMDNMEDYDYVIDAMNQGYRLPLTAINRELKFYGGISNRMIADSIRRLN
ncbi:hypothetical protein RZO55_21565 [Clostridium boliviensis]|uniref:Uncharacterized protein n=1 Tax=Clostridium boliviensis TaxID=318465 RepID=A0ABU4GRE9_9CLOT|nr:hypothetical protein [Clostridium boliviensis]MDW2800164.1 hypothetical protein [Clostridium boliviensis]